MKKLLLMLSCCLTTWCSAQTWLKYDTSSSATPSAPQRTVEKVSDGVIVTYTFSGATITKDDLYTNAYMWNIDGFTANTTQTEPAYLQKVDQFVIPEGMDATVSLVSTSTKTYTNYEMSPARIPLIEDDNYTLSNVPAIATYSGYLPKTGVVNGGVELYRGNKVLNVKVYPIRYAMSSKTVIAYKKLKYKVKFTSSAIEADESPKPVKDSYLKKTAIMYDFSTRAIETESSDSPSATSYLIITSDKYKTQAEKLADWKKMLGFNTFVVSNSKWSTTAVRNTVKEYYENKGIEYLLIMGDYEDIPGENGIKYSIYTPITDYMYCCMDGTNDKTADIYRGRISVSSAAEADVVVNKIINYEKYPVTDSNFWKNALHCAYFQDDNSDGQEDRPSRQFFQTSEQILDLVANNGKNITRALWAKDNVNPFKFNNGDTIPEYLQKPNHKWKDGSKKISDAVNSGCFYVLYRGHGATTCWGNPYFSNSDVSALTNGNKLPVVFSITCLTGAYAKEPSCFAETWLRKQGGGAAGIIASHEVSYSGINDVFAKEMFKSIWPSDATSEPVYRMGQVLDVGLVNMANKYGNSNSSLYTKQSFHYFGDPSMMLTTETPTEFKNVYVSRVDGKITVNLASGVNGQITLYDSSNGEMLTYYGNSYTFNISDASSDSVKLCVSDHNKIPYIKEVPLPATGEIISATFNASENAITVNYNIKHTKTVGLELLYTVGGKVVRKQEYNASSNPTSAKISTTSLAAGRYVVILSVNGQRCDDIYVDIATPKPTGGIQNFSYDVNKKTITVDYITKYVSNSSIRIFKNGTTTLVKKISVPNSATSNRYSIDISSLAAGTTYCVKLYGDETVLDTRTFATPPTPTPTPTTAKSEITSLSFDKSSQTITVNYNLVNATSAKVDLIYTVGGRTVKTQSIDVHSNHSYISTSSFSAGTYVVVLYVNGSGCDGKNISVTK